MGQASRVLIVDDEPGARLTLRGLLAAEPYELLLASSGHEALRLAKLSHPDTILCDVMMPEMDGYDLCRQVRATPELAEVPIILVSVLDDRGSRLCGLEAGADDFIAKPYDPTELRARLRTITRLNRYRKLSEERVLLDQAHRDLQSAYRETIEGWSRALDLRDHETEGHSQRVTNLTVDLARFLGLPESELELVRLGALLHDVGKLGVPDNILHKPGKLTEEEWVVMKKHPVYARDLLQPIKHLREAIDIPYCHHERWDGSGYPQGLRGDDIPLHARIFAVIDVWDAMLSDRPYRKALDRRVTIDYVREQAGRHFDPCVAAAFLRYIDAERDVQAVLTASRQ